MRWQKAGVSHTAGYFNDAEEEGSDRLGKRCYDGERADRSNQRCEKDDVGANEKHIGKRGTHGIAKETRPRYGS